MCYARLKITILSIIILTTIFILLCLTAGPSYARRDTLESGTVLKGIAFDEFWRKVKEEGDKWANDKLYIRKISSGTVRGFDKHDGLSPLWEAQIVKCNELQEQITSGKHLSICKGKTVTLRMVESGIIGLEPGLHVKKEGNFRGGAVSFERIKFSAQAAEDTANGHMHYRSMGFDNYTYDLKIDHFSNKPVWIIKKACSGRGVLERRCRPKDHWIVKVDAETGQIIK
ncbi:MAG: hypothetical protein C0399_05130 [Syntrophus sp. (in: bacteria)]|nr:hypothetical protein [Syntrophus sp. (in: bacteria)]